MAESERRRQPTTTLCGCARASLWLDGAADRGRRRGPLAVIVAEYMLWEPGTTGDGAVDGKPTTTSYARSRPKKLQVLDPSRVKNRYQWLPSGQIANEPGSPPFHAAPEPALGLSVRSRETQTRQWRYWASWCSIRDPVWPIPVRNSFIQLVGIDQQARPAADAASAAEPRIARRCTTATRPSPGLPPLSIGHLGRRCRGLPEER